MIPYPYLPLNIRAYQLMLHGMQALARAEQQGLRVNTEYCQRQKDHLTKRISRLECQLKDTKFYRHWEHTTGGKVNIHSNAQLSRFLYTIKKLEPARKTDTGQGSTDEEALKALGLPELDLLLQIRKLQKVRDTYLDAFMREQVRGYVHPFYNLHLVRTYRSSSDSPNFQNIPKRDEEAMQLTHKALYPRPRHQILEVDFSGLEVRIAACYHHDQNMLRYINNPGSDMHLDMAKQLFRMSQIDQHTEWGNILRQAAKNGFVFPEFYGDYYGNCARGIVDWVKLPQGRWTAGMGIDLEQGKISGHMLDVGIKSFNHFTDHVKEVEKDFWNNRFQEYAQWKERWWRDYQKKGYIDMLSGFRCSGVMSHNDCINYPIQGAAFHCLLWCFVKLDKIMREEGWDTRLVGQIHDDIILDVEPKELDHVARTVHRVTTLDLRKAWSWVITGLDVKAELSPVDGSWAEKKYYELPDY